MFSTFPDGWAGAGLLLLRATVGVGLIVQGTAYFADNRDLGLLTVVVAVLTIAVGILLLFGCLTRFSAVVAALVSMLSMFSWFPGPHVGMFETQMTTGLAIVIAAAVICLGSGAFSIDARLFGRREVIIPQNVPETEI
jgi:uncharacterized membrane protein YphA (DoxX/SURF4 family)